MPDDITIQPRTEATSPTQANTADTGFDTPADESSPSLSICGLGLLVSFFLPWITFLGSHRSGFDIQRLGSEQKLFWVIPALAAITVIAGIVKQHQRVVARAAGIIPYFALLIGFAQMGRDLFYILSIGAYLSLFFALGLTILPRRFP